MKIFIVVLFWLNFTYASVVFTPSDVYSETLKIEEELKIIKRHFGITKRVESFDEIRASLKPRNVWQMGYVVLVKINTLRSKYNMPIVTANSMAPVLHLDPNLVYEQMNRVLSEIRIFKARLGINEEIKPIERVSGKEPIDVFNKLLYISSELDIINTKEISPSAVFSELMRIYEDITIILNRLEIKDNTIPPIQIQTNITPKDVFNEVFKLVDELHRIQRLANIERIDLSSFTKEDIKPNDVFILVEMVITGLQPVKAFIGLKHELTPPARHYEGKKPIDNIKLIGWIIERFKLIDSLIKG